MLHACVQRFDMMKNIEKNLGTKQGLYQQKSKSYVTHCMELNKASKSFVIF